MDRRELFESMKTRKFWHICEVCGKKEFITAEEAFKNGWDYPPYIGSFGVVSARTCGDCIITGTLYWKLINKKEKEIRITELSDREFETLQRIYGEPESLL